MVDSDSWSGSAWFNAIQTIGIVGSLLVAAAAERRASRAREIGNLLTLAQHHRELWEAVYPKTELARVFRSDADVLGQAATPAEEVFLNEAIIQFQTSWCIATRGGLITERDLATDAGGFFSLPLPRAVWEKTKEFRNPRFVKFVTRAIERHGPLSDTGH
jgi:hypothetical protein